VGLSSAVPAEPRARHVETQPGVSHHGGLSATRSAGVPAAGTLQIWRGRERGGKLLHCDFAGTRYE